MINNQKNDEICDIVIQFCFNINIAKYIKKYTICYSCVNNINYFKIPQN